MNNRNITTKSGLIETLYSHYDVSIKVDQFYLISYDIGK